MVKVITYGTYDLLHYGHIKLLQRAKALGDYLIVAVTADDFDKTRGKINVKQSLVERIEAVKSTGLADQIIVEEYEGQKIDDIKRYDVDIFTVGSDWVGKFDYLKSYCKVVYLPRTEGVSSTELRKNVQNTRIGLVGYSSFINKVYREASSVSGVEICKIYSRYDTNLNDDAKKLCTYGKSYSEFLEEIDAVYIHSNPHHHYKEVKEALLYGKHVLCESPLSMSKKQCLELIEIAKDNNLVLMEALRTAYSTAFSRLLLLVKGGKIGKVTSIDVVCTSLSTNNDSVQSFDDNWGSLAAWGPTALLPVFELLSTDYVDNTITTMLDNNQMDVFTKIDLRYLNAVASIKVGTGVKAEGELIISGTEGYVFVPAPWWKTDYFEIRFENPLNNKRYFYQLDGEGIPYEFVAFMRAVNGDYDEHNISNNISCAISDIMEQFEKKSNIKIIRH